ncbi:lipoprotein-releasing ABC transporter permease subunit [Desulfobotulus sp.]|jgi:lipoprotein-releasing system permease protein|uniref:lipoprotein-releasing ABC transporter permease subunit n=1 Tax=Desulfobotulus sp. TaxID=1940337 RepID=UPI002A3628A1|nr:lipoprotein-releasing ABC transporter permease subunit [Desulfobotulus sp.]MDY0162942.1 lipoprotein-releasing ABC transporter permease subunit [Desulfobotulus sp.]
MPLELFIAGRYLRARRKQGFISLIGILSVFGVALGVMALVVVIAVMSGAETDFRKRILGLEPHVLLMGQGGGLQNPDLAREMLEKMPGVAATAPFVYGKVVLRASGGMGGAFLRGIDPSGQRVSIEGVDRESIMVQLKVPEAGALPGIILGKNLASELGVIIGDTVQVMSPEFMLSPVGMLPKVRRFQVTGLFSSGLYEYDGALCYVHIEEASRLMGMGEKVTGIGIWIDDVYAAESLGERIRADFGWGYWTRNWMEMNKNLFSALKLEKAAMFIILTLIILVAAFNIASSLIMLVMEKTRDISILMAMGATRRLVRRIFVIQGMIIGLMGTIIGVASGVALCSFLERYPIIRLPEAYPFTTLPVLLEWGDVLVIGLASLAICFFSTLYPAMQASRLDPVEGIRYG